MANGELKSSLKQVECSGEEQDSEHSQGPLRNGLSRARLNEK